MVRYCTLLETISWKVILDQVYAQYPNHKTVYQLDKTTAFYPDTNEHLIYHNAHPSRQISRRSADYRSVSHLLPPPAPPSRPVVIVTYPRSNRVFNYTPSPRLYAPSVWPSERSPHRPTTDHEIVVCRWLTEMFIIAETVEFLYEK